MKSKAETKREEEEEAATKSTNYSFRLKCLIGLTCAAVATAAIMIALAATTGTAAGAGAAAGASIAAGALASPLAPFIGLMVVIGAICLLPLLFIGRSSSGSTPFFSTFRGYNPTVFVGSGHNNHHTHYPSSGFPGAHIQPVHSHSHNHSHAHSGGGYGGGHQGGGNVHGHR
jgi:hypothetical protein